MPSIFSRIVAGELPAYKVAEDADHLAFLDITPLVEGHTLVIPKKETDYIFDLPAHELAALHLFAQRVAQGVRAAVPCRRVGVAVIGLEVPHAHIHLIPMSQVADMNFANPKIKVPEERMRELAAAIAAKIDDGATATPAAPAPDAVLADLQQLVEGLYFVSESDAPLEAVSYPAPAGEPTAAALCQLLGEPVAAPVDTIELTLFLRNHTADDGVLRDIPLSDKYKTLQLYLKQELSDVRVYRIGRSPQVHAYALGRTAAGQLAGFKTVLTTT